MYLKQAAVEQISKMAPQGIDVLINNAGIASENPDRVPENMYVDIYDEHAKESYAQMMQFV